MKRAGKSLRVRFRIFGRAFERKARSAFEFSISLSVFRKEIVKMDKNNKTAVEKTDKKAQKKNPDKKPNVFVRLWGKKIGRAHV